MCIDPEKQYQATIETNHGTMQAFLYPQRAPRTVNNFVCLARHKYYDGLTFHRIIRDFMIQGGCPEGSGRGNPGYRFADELPNPGEYEIGSLAMANAGPDTNGSQFFIVSGPHGVGLPPQYSLFGKLIDGLDVLDTLQKVQTGAQDRPTEPVVIEKVTITESD
ncbi:MAG: peptidylprolyl isomerase [Microthrixaceae bacterium]|nr:peptidylprolyl isomerase [Microthrixaceae bacterium]MCO5317504.1 peptidylprolyl isomerase [Microthrixaceae bacterium]